MPEETRLQLERLVKKIIGSSASVTMSEANDTAAEAAPVRTEETVAPESAPQENEPRGTRLAPPESPSLFSSAARNQDWQQAITECRDIPALKKALENAPEAPLRAHATNLVFADGNPTSEVMIIGEAPGAEEDRLGLPFVGKSGKLLDQALELLGWTRANDYYITNVIPWRPPGNRTPSAQEVEYFLPYLKQHIALSNAKYLLLLGAVATSALLDFKSSLSKLRGKSRIININGKDMPVLVTYHPAYLLRQPSAKKLFWSDLLAFRRLMRANRQNEG